MKRGPGCHVHGIWALVQFRTGPKPDDGIKAKAHRHTIVLCMHHKRFIPSVIGPMRNLWRGVNFFGITQIPSPYLFSLTDFVTLV